MDYLESYQELINTGGSANSKHALRLVVKKCEEPLIGELNVPNSKYHAHRALMLASLAPGQSVIKGLSDAGHVRHTVAALRALGTKIKVEEDTFIVNGGAYHPKKREISVGSSGTTLYFMTGLSSLADEPVTIVGQRYFQRRPIKPLLEALNGLGVKLSSETGCPPINVEPYRPKGGQVSISGMLSQWISGLLLIAPFATGPSVINVEGPFNERSYIDLTIRMMALFGLHVEVLDGGRRFEIEPNQQPHPASLMLPPDIGSAAFGLAAAALHPCDVIFRGLKASRASETDHPEADLLDIVRRMGLQLHPDPTTGDMWVRHDGIELTPIEVDCRKVPDMLPVLSVLGTFARGTTRLSNVAHVRLKESDRVSAMLQLNRMGGDLELRGNSLICHGVERLSGTDLSSFNDHRVLMALAVAASKADGESSLTYPNAYRISYPRFLQEMNGVGMPMSVDRILKTKPASGQRRTKKSRSLDLSSLAKIPIYEYVERWANERPGELSVVDVGSDGKAERSLTWKELNSASLTTAARLLELGVQPGEAVAYQLQNCVEFVIMTLATLRIGAICCPVMPIFRQRELTFALRRSRARVLVIPKLSRGRNHEEEIMSIIGSDLGNGLDLEHVMIIGDDTAEVTAGIGSAPPKGEEAQDRSTIGWHRIRNLTEMPSSRSVEAMNPQVNAAEALAQLLFTSGTSGEPKGVLHRMDTLTKAAAMQIRHLGLTRDDKVFIPSPLAHQTGFLYGMWVAFLLGTTQIIQPIWDGEVALSVMRRWKTTFIQAATPFLADLVKASEERGEPPEALRIFVATGAAVPRGLAEYASRVLDTAVCGAWGTTETCLGSLSAPYDEPAKTWGTDGRPLEGIRMRITDDDGKPLAQGQEGNLEVYSQTLFAGYLDHPDWTAEVLTQDGWYRTGDLAVLDESGYLRLRGRIKDVINRGGEKVPVGEIEELLHAHPEVRDVAIVSMPDERLGERACAFVVATGNFDFAKMKRYLDSCHVAKQYWPERLEFLEALPRNPAGKVQKFLLRDLIRELVEKESSS